ncbi:MAG: ROK family protein [Actinomycetota bacterium]|nr:ROK family protein [Actinomycetota bacterium]
MSTTIGVDLGGTKVLAAVVHHGKPGKAIKQPTPTNGPAAVVEAIVNAVKQLGGAHRVGLGTPGVVDQATGTVSHAPNLVGWKAEVALRDMLEQALPGTEVRVDNDVNVGVLGEQSVGAARGHDDVLGVFAGTGVGGALVLDGKLRRGPRGITGEIGHVIVVPDGRRCGCGGAGHLEAYAGRAGIEAEARRRHAAGVPTALVELAGEGNMKSGVIAKALAAGDPMALELIDGAIVALGTAIASAVTLVDITTVVLGGGITEKLGADFVTRVDTAVQARVIAGVPVNVVAAVLGDDAGVVGAASLFD